MARKLWSNPESPPEWVARQLHPPMTRHEFSAALHRIKRAAGLKGADRVSIWEDGDVTDADEQVIGNLHAEF